MIWVLTLVVSVALCRAQSISGLGTSGGGGPTGGSGDSAHRITEPQSFITDMEFSSSSSRKLAKFDVPKMTVDVGAVSEAHNVHIDASNSTGKRQELVGFGHAWTDATVEVFNSLSKDVLDQLMKDLFSKEGINMGLMRHTIGSSDLSRRPYTYNDNNGRPDPNLDNFDLTADGKDMVRMIVKMGEYKGDVTLVGTPWSAPGWMKRGGDLVPPNFSAGQQWNWGNNSLAVKYHKVYAEYLAKYVDEFAKYGVNVNAITPENEPFNNQGGYPTMWLGAADEASLIKDHLGQMMKQRDVQVWAWDHNTDQPAYPMRVMETAEEYTQGAGWHCYQGPIANYSILTDFHNSYPDKLQFMTECGSDAKSFGIASNFIQPVNNWASGGTQWTLATNESYGPHSSTGGCENCLGSIVVNDDGTYTKTQNYYMMGHFTKFIRRGSNAYHVKEGNVGTDLDDENFYTMAAKNPDGSWVIELMNNFKADKNVVVTLDGDDGSPLSWSGSVPKKSLVTWLLPDGLEGTLNSIANITIPEIGVHPRIKHHRH